MRPSAQIKSYTIKSYTYIAIMQIIVFGLPSNADNKKLIAESGRDRVQVIELFSSESCSSCPPADEWVSHLKDKSELWKKFVPVVFHVDYWNYLDWKDEFSSHAMTQRQIDLAHRWTSGGGGVYTPAFIVNGKEWPDWRNFTNHTLPPQNEKSNITLSIYQKTKNSYQVVVQGQKTNQKYTVRIARLGFDVTTNVRSGENSGKLLKHNFLVINWDSQNVSDKKTEVEFSFNDTNVKISKFAIAAWIEEDGNPTPLQATGAYL